MIHDERIKVFNDKKIVGGEYVLYWMQASQRSYYNHALEYAIDFANTLNLPIIVIFVLIEGFSHANERHYKFMLEGITEVQKDLKKRKIKMIIRKDDPVLLLQKLCEHSALLISDIGYLNYERFIRFEISKKINCYMVGVESNIIVPVEEASPKEEYGAYTIRPKINKKIDKYLIPLKNRLVKISSLDYSLKSLDIKSIDKVIDDMNIDKSVKKSPIFNGGFTEANSHLDVFIKEKLEFYSNFKNHPGLDYSSNLSPYIHFGQISPLYIALKITKTNYESKNDFLEELIIRRELSINYIYYNTNYDSKLEAVLPNWANETLKHHDKDQKEFIYTLTQLENAQTHDDLWNAAQKEMNITGKMHGYMRMYWGKKIIEWAPNIKDAFNWTIYLNDKYSIDGRDPNGYAGIAWCYGKHDRAWKERDIFGKIRYMNYNGLVRKFDMSKYLNNNI